MSHYPQEAQKSETNMRNQNYTNLCSMEPTHHTSALKKQVPFFGLKHISQQWRHIDVYVYTCGYHCTHPYESGIQA